MPIPTDTFWNVKKLNVVFALSSLALLAVTFWAVVQDHEKDWRVPQKQARVWESALTNQKIQAELTPEERLALDGLEKQIDHDLRYDMADEFVDCASQLWDAWEPDAVVMDEEARRMGLD